MLSRMTASSWELDARWLETLHRLVGRAAHELKGALNGVSVNQEVIRSRSENPNATATAVRSFAVAAAGQLDVVISLTNALLGLTRPAREPVDVGLEAGRIAILLGAVARSDGKQLTVDDAAGAGLSGLGVTSAPGSAVRLSLCECMLAAVDASTDVRCIAVAGSPTPTVRIDNADGETTTLDAALLVAAEDAGVHIHVSGSAISISFPPPFGGMTERE